jgi:hypothetical protein
MQDGSFEKIPYKIAVGHELTHSDHNRLGIMNTTLNEIPGIKNNEELHSIKRENLLRKEHNLSLRYSGEFIKK